MSGTERIYLRRDLVNRLAMLLSGAAAIFGLFFLIWILWTTVSKGLGSLNSDLFTMMTPPPDERGGLLNAIVGSVIINFMAIAIGTPIGIAAAEVPTIIGIPEPERPDWASASRAASHARRVPRSMRAGNPPSGRSIWPAVPTRWRETSNSVTGENALRPARKPAVFSRKSMPIGETIPAPVTTTRRGSEGAGELRDQAKATGDQLRLVTASERS